MGESLAREPRACCWCGRAKPTHRCKRCAVAMYCSRDCQVQDWRKRHKNECEMWDLIETAVTASMARRKAARPPPPGVRCWCCLESSGELLFTACGCRDGFVHLGCLAHFSKEGKTQIKGQGYATVDNQRLWVCPVCSRLYDGVVFVGAARFARASLAKLRALDQTVPARSFEPRHRERYHGRRWSVVSCHPRGRQQRSYRQERGPHQDRRDNGAARVRQGALEE